jgi:cell division protein FtsB
VHDVTVDQFPLGKVVAPRWAAVLVVLLVIVVALSFNARLATMQQMRKEEARLKQAVSVEQARRADLQSLRSYVASDAYVEHWARVEAKMIKPGEVVIVPVAPNVAPTNPTPPAPVQTPKTILEEWWSLFFGEATATP